MGSHRTEQVLHEALYSALHAAHDGERAIRDARSIMRLTIEHLNGTDRAEALRTMIDFWVGDHGAT